MNRTSGLTLMTMLACTLVATAARAQSNNEIKGTTAKAGASVGDAHKEKLLHDISRAAQPDEHHKWLMPLVGKWTTKAKQWLGGPHPETATGHADVKAILGGRFVEEKYDSVIFGKPYQSQLDIGYDTRAKKYVAVWLDTWGTWITNETGSADEAGKKLTLTADEPDDGGKTRPVKFIWDIDSNDHHVMRMYEMIEGKETLTLEIEYKKAK